MKQVIKLSVVLLGFGALYVGIGASVQTDRLREVARRLATQKEQTLTVKEQERLMREKVAKEAHEERVMQRQEVDFLRLARETEKRRQAKISSWRNYMNIGNASKCLIKAISQVDKTSEQEVKELQMQVEMFRDERLKGSLKKYPELESFLQFSISEPAKKSVIKMVKVVKEKPKVTSLKPIVKKHKSLMKKRSLYKEKFLEFADEFSTKIDGCHDSSLSDTFKL